ncbi:MAG: glutamate synthase subunit beta [Clostridia bacterium]|nr:glutamate synthase subunit beta [Clostridia bacterium]
MGLPTGFIEYARQIPADRDPMDRIGDWDEFHDRLTPEELRRQGARCMNCGIPYCLTGMMINNMVSGCPLHNLMPEFNDLAYHGLWRMAWKRLRKTNNFPEFTGRVCPAPCEGACTCGLPAEPVAIKNIECSIIDTAFERGWQQADPPAVRTGKRVAVVGSGPSGLAAADQLNQAGHRVTVYERADRVGGLLMYGIPNMKLDKRIVTRRVEQMSAEGVEFVTRCEVGKDYPADRLLAEHDAVVLCGGATKPRDLPVEGRNLKGIHFAVDFLTANTRSLLDSGLTDGKNLSAEDKDVVIIGGGDTGTDCVGTALRHRCRSVRQMEIMPKSPDEREAANPWPQYPRIHKVDYGQEEAIRLNGADPRSFCVTAKRFVGDADGRVREVHTVGVEWVRDDSGRMSMREVPGSERIWPAQLVLLAMGFLGPEDTLLEQLGVARNPRSNVETRPDGYATSVDKVFAAGDMRRGQSLVVWGISEGRQAAREVDMHLMGRTNLK